MRASFDVSKSRSNQSSARTVFLLAIVGGWLSMILSAHADSGAASSIAVDYPLFIVNGSSIEKLRDHSSYVFDLAKRSDEADLVELWFATEGNRLAGLDCDRPIGTMFYFPSDTVCLPIGILYIPITDLEEALRTVSLGRGVVSEVQGKKGWNTIHFSDNYKAWTRQVGNYLFLVGPDGNETALDRNFPDPARFGGPLSKTYDMAVSLPNKRIDLRTKKLLSETLKQASLAHLQQRDGENESSYLLRRFYGENLLDLMNLLIAHTEEIVIGVRIDSQKRRAHFDIEVSGPRDGKLARLIQSASGKQSGFGNLLTNPSTLTMSVSWLLNVEQRSSLNRVLDSVRHEIGRTAVIGTKYDSIFKSLGATVENGHIDAFAQLSGDSRGEYKLIAGAKIVGGRQLSTQVGELLQHLGDNAPNKEFVTGLEPNASEIDSCPVHRIAVNLFGDHGQYMFGENAKLYLCVAPQAIWVTFGGEESVDRLREAIAQQALPQPTQRRNGSLVMISTHASNLQSAVDEDRPSAVAFSVSDPDAFNRQKRRAEFNRSIIAFNKQSRTALESGNDGIQFNVLSTETGLRLRVDFEEGLLALLGRGIARRLDSALFASRP